MPLTNEVLAIHIQNGETDLIPQLWAQVRALICRYALRFHDRQQERCEASGATVDDLIQEAYFAFLQAVQAYDPAAG